jgi:hypothetical protein
MSVHLHLDLVGGMAGDMTVAALLDAGCDAEALLAELAGSGLPAAELEAERLWHAGMAGTRFHVADELDPPHRDWAAIRQLLRDASLPAPARDRALDVFERLALAEAETHGCTPDEVHFHEVGALDSIIDIVAASLALHRLDVSSASCGSVPVCDARVSTAHGMLPVPAPATARLLMGFTLLPIPGAIETITPTGAALLAHLCPAGGGDRPACVLSAVGTGLGTAELPDRPNVLRVLLGQPVPRGAGGDGSRADAVVIEANIDDMDPRLYGEVAAELFGAGALDVALVPLQMKKGRPGTQLQIISRPELEGLLSGIVLRSTTTLGVRSYDVRRTELQRRHETVTTAFGSVRLKLGLLGSEAITCAPEYDDCVARAKEHGVPVKDVLAAAQAVAPLPGARPSEDSRP